MKRQNAKTSTSQNPLWHRLIAGAVCLALSAGCAQLNNPYVDSSAAINEEMTTSSTQGYLAGGPESGRPTGRTWRSSCVLYTNGAVTHWPLWFEDPFEDIGNRYCPVADRDAPDNVFCWNWVDYMHIGYGPGRELVNIAGWPVSAVVTPPGTLMESDGYLSKGLLGNYDHDAQRADCASEPPFIHPVDRPYQSDDEHHEPATESHPVETQPVEP
jgi:hypothetical protein